MLAPFSSDALATLGRQVSFSYESWTQTGRLYSPEELSQRLNDEGIAILVVEADFVFEEVFQESKHLRFLGVCRTSLAHIDLEAATQHGVLVVNTPARNARAVAELTLALMLCLARRVPQLNCYVKEGCWESPVEAYISYKGSELQDKTLGLIGLGSVGRTVSRLGRALGMRALAYDPFAGQLGQRKAGALLTNLEYVLKEAEFLSLHAPSSPETIELLGEKELGMMKGGSYLINTASHSLVKEEALVEHLTSGHLRGAALDVHEAHPIPPSSPLLKLDNVILTPHVGGATQETIERHSSLMLDGIKRFLQGRKPRCLANPEVWRRSGR